MNASTAPYLFALAIVGAFCSIFTLVWCCWPYLNGPRR